MISEIIAEKKEEPPLLETTNVLVNKLSMRIVVVNKHQAIQTLAASYLEFYISRYANYPTPYWNGEPFPGEESSLRLTVQHGAYLLIHNPMTAFFGGPQTSTSRIVATYAGDGSIISR